MVKTPNTRHSKSRRDPVTIELEPGEVSRVAEDPASPEVHDRAADEQARRDSQSQTTDDRPSPAEQPAGPTAGPDESAPGKGSAQHPSRQSPRGGFSALVAGLAGGVIALAGAGALQYAGVLGAPGKTTGSHGDIAALQSEVAALRQSDGGGETMARLNDLSAALDKVRSDLQAVRKPVEAGNGAGGPDAAAFQALGDKVAGLENSVAALQRATPDPDSSRASVDLGPVEAKLASLEAEARQAAEAASGRDGRLSRLEQSMAQLSGKVEAQASQPKIALSIAASALKSALDRGAPFTSELDTFAAIAPDAPEVDVLRAYAEKGVPSRAEIAEGMDAAANAMVAAARPADENAGVFERLLSSAESLVKVRPIGAVEGPGVPETVARMEAAVKQGDYARALSEYDTLPETARAAGADYAAGLRARMEAEAQVDALVSSAMKA